MNPWISVAPADYEAHMSAPAVAQLPVLAGILARDLADLRPSALLLVGCATGNGFERIDPAVTRRVVGLDINPAFLAVARARHGKRLPGLELIAGDVLDPALAPGAFDLVHAALVFEHTPWQALLPRIAGWLRPGGTLSVVLQLPSSESAPVSASVIAARYPGVAETMRLVDPAAFELSARELGLGVESSDRLPLPQGKAFLAVRLRR